MAAGLDRRRTRLHVLGSRRGLAGFPARLAMRGRHAAELTHQLRSVIVNAAHAARARVPGAARCVSRRATCGRRFAAIRGKLDAATGRLHAGIGRRHDRAAARLGAAVGRLESLSPLAVLGRGYAVCWNDDRTAILRQRRRASPPGDRVHVTLHDGELSCVVEVHGPHGGRAADNTVDRATDNTDNTD